MHPVRIALSLMFVLLLAGASLPALSHADAAGKKVVMVVSQSGFEDKEYSKTREALEDAGIIVSVASEEVGTAKGQKAAKAEVSYAYADVNVAEFDAVVFIGGKGSPAMVNNADAQALARAAMESGMLVGAICYSPVVLAKAGVVEGRTLTSADAWGAKGDIKRAGGTWKNTKVHEDGNLITGNGPKAASAFGDALVDALSK